MKLAYFGKLTDSEIQILIFLSHVVVRDLVESKIYGRTYEGLINPEELLDFLKRFKIEIQNNGEVYIDGKLIGQSSKISGGCGNNSRNLNPNYNDNFSVTNLNNNNSAMKGNQSTYSYLNSEYSKDDN